MKGILFFYHLIVQLTIVHASDFYLGCFIDHIGDRDLKIFISDDIELTVEQCVRACRAEGYLYAAIQYGNECRCDDHFGKYGQVSDDQCHYRCSPSELCGGDYRNSVYRISDSGVICQNNLIGYQGCFTRITLPVNVGQVNSIEQCVQRCATHYSYAGIRNGYVCQCGNDLNQPASTSDLCQRSCATSVNDQVKDCCGGRDVLSVYNVNYYQPSSLSNDSSATIIRVKRADVITGSTYVPTITSSSSSTGMSASSSRTNLPTSTIYTSTISSQTSSFTSRSLGTLLSTLTNNQFVSGTIHNTNVVSSSSTLNGLISTSNIVTSRQNPFSMASIGSQMSSTTMVMTSPSITAMLTSQNARVTTGSVSSQTSSTIVTTMMTSTQYNTVSSQIPIISTIQSSMVSRMTSQGSNTLALVLTSSRTNPTSATIIPTNSHLNLGIITSLTSSVSKATDGTTTVMSNSASITSVTSTIAITTVTTSVPSAAIMSTVFSVSTSQTFDPTANATRESIRQGLNNTINLAFLCLTSPSTPNCTQTSRRSKRQTCSNGYTVNLVSNITPVTGSTSSYTVTYVVLNLCSSSLVPPETVKTATDTLTAAQIERIFGFSVVGDFIQSSTINTSTPVPTTDRKLWLIGAILGPIAFVFLLIFVFCYLHYKCRPRPSSRALNKPVQVTSPRTTNYQNLTNEPVKEKPAIEQAIPVLVANDPFIGTQSVTNHFSLAKEPPKASRNLSPSPVSTDIPLEELRRQTDVERWRNKLRLQEKYQQSESRRTSTDMPTTTEEFRPIPEPAVVGDSRQKLHRLLDEAIDQAAKEENYNPDSAKERVKRRRQRRRNPSTFEESPHIPVIAHVMERPDPSIIQAHYNPYEAGDRAFAISRLQPVDLKPKYLDDERIAVRSTRSNPPIFFDDSIIADRAATATDHYGNPKRQGRVVLENDRQAMMRRHGGEIDQRQHRFQGDVVYVDSISKKTRLAWDEPSESNNNDYRDEYLMAKRSVANTKNILSSIQDELQTITSDQYHA